MTDIDPTLPDNSPPEVSTWTRRGLSGWQDPEMLQAANDDRDDGANFFRGMFNALVFVAVIAALVGLYLVMP